LKPENIASLIHANLILTDQPSLNYG